MAEIVASNEPRLLQQVAFPSAYLYVFRSFLENVERDANGDFDSESPDDYDSEISRMEDFEAIVEKIRSMLSSLEDQAQVVQAALTSAQSNLSAARDEKFPEPPDDYEDRAPASRPSGGFDVDELFADL